MRFFYPNKNKIKVARENYVKEFRVNKELTITPCNKFVAVLEKLSKNYSLALRDSAHIETLQVANQNDIEFYEGYEFAPNYTDSVRQKIARSTYSIYNIVGCIILGLDSLEKLSTNDKRVIVNDIKLSLSVINNIISNVYQHITMTNENIVFEGCDGIPNGIKEIIEYIKNLIIKAINELTALIENTTIEYIVRQVEIIIEKLRTYFEEIANM